MPKKSFRIGVGPLLTLVTGLLFVVVSIIFGFLTDTYVRQRALTEAEAKTRILLDRNLATHTYFTHDLKPSLFEWTEPFRPDDYFDPKWMSSTYAVREIDEYFKSLSPADYYYKECAIDARSPENEADAYERTFIEEMNQNPELEERSIVRVLEGQPYFVTLRRGEVMEKSCLRCHDTAEQAPGGLVDRYGPERSFGREIGETVSAISIRVPLASAYAGATGFTRQISGILAVLLLCLFGAQFWLNRRLLLKPVNRIRDKALLIAAGGDHLGEQISLPFGKELRALTIAFNTMSRNLRRNRDQLERRVYERTIELQESNQRLQKALASLQATQEQLVEQERLAAVGQMAGGIAHEFNNLMTPVIIYADQMLRSSPLALENKEKLIIIHEQTRRAADLTQQILDFSRRTILARRELELVPFVAKTTDLLVHTVPGNVRIHFSATPAASGLSVNADPTCLQQAVMNLAANAQDAMPDGGELHIRVERVEKEGIDWARLTVSDNGVGIPEDALPHIFEPFFTTKDVGEGAGLGLAQVYGIVKQHSGDIDVSTKAGQGSTFTITLPALPTPPPQAPRQRGEEAPALMRGQGEMVLVVVENHTVRKAMVSVLEMLGYQVLVAEDGRQALCVAEREHGRLRLVLGDMTMPEVDGKTLALELQERAPGVPMVVLTSYPLTNEDSTALHTAGVVGWLQKPVDLEQLAEVVARALL